MNKLNEKKLFLLDMDGTIYLDDNLFEGTKELLEWIKSHGAVYSFMTNNSSKGTESYIEKLKKMGVEATKRDFVTSVDGLIYYLEKQYGEGCKTMPIYLVGTRSFKKQLLESGFDIIDENGLTIDEIEKKTELLVVGFDRELDFNKLEKACILLTREKRHIGKPIKYIATNPDWVCPTCYGSVPDCGSICQMIENATDKLPMVIGKPGTIMAYMALEKYGCTKEDTLIIGDRIYTDIKCGKNAGIDTAFVLSGEGTIHDIEKENIRPEYIFRSVKEILNEIKGEQYETR